MPQKQKQGQDTSIDRTKWQPGPWDTEPDLVWSVDAATGLSLLLYRIPCGAWASLVGIDSQFRNIALQLQASYRTRPRHLEIVTFDVKAKHADKLDLAKLYVGFMYASLDDARPAELHYLNMLTEELRQEYAPRYVTLAQATKDAVALAQTLAAAGVNQ